MGKSHSQPLVGPMRPTEGNGGSDHLWDEHTYRGEKLKFITPTEQFNQHPVFSFKDQYKYLYD